MKKSTKKCIEKFIKKNWYKIIAGIVTAMTLIALYRTTHDTATQQRGYEAIGGEIFILAIPAFAYIVKRNYDDLKKMLEE